MGYAIVTRSLAVWNRYPASDDARIATIAVFGQPGACVLRGRFRHASAVVKMTSKLQLR